MISSDGWPDLRHERSLWSRGIRYVAGIDEAGRGALAGPVVAAAVILPPDRGIKRTLCGVRDSKQMRPLERDRWAARIQTVSLSWGVGLASSEEIDLWGIVQATRLAMQRAVEGLKPFPEYLLIDFVLLSECPLPQTAIPKGDLRSLSIAAASVLAKTNRDTLMCELDAEFPEYGFAQHKGYSTAAHRDAIQRYGASRIHRRTFAPLCSRSFDIVPLETGDSL
ncbi:MAG: ribonuclease HII [Chloroflexota bacterium]